MKSEKSLNKAQESAVAHRDGSLMVIAGAGTGKTRVITHRIARLIEGGVPPEAILAVTFTNRAAGEMRERVQALLGREILARTGLGEGSMPTVCTFHALGVSILRANFREAGVPKRFAIFDRGDSLRAVKEALKDTKLAETHDPGKILAIISQKKGEGITSDAFKEETVGEYFWSDVSDVWARYDELVARARALDFDDLLVKTHALLRNIVAVRRAYQERYRFIHVDEYQDTNAVQYETVRLLAGERKNVCVVGDIDQNIYTWRGARIKHLLSFADDFPGATVVTLTENYRSTKTVIAAANRIIEKNTVRHKKRLETENPDGERIGFFVASTGEDEAMRVALNARDLIASGVSPKEIAVLYRTNFQSRLLEEAFLAQRIPYQVVGTRFLERREVKDIIAYLVAAEDPARTEHVKRIVNVPARGIGKVTVLKMFAGKISELSGATRSRVDAFYALLERINDRMTKEKPSDVVKFVIRESGIDDAFSKGSDDDRERLENLRELVTLSLRYDGLPRERAVGAFLEDVALASDQDALSRDEPSVKLMTVHAAKGLEFDHVFVTGLEEGLFPHERANNARTIEEAEEERRLCYVAFTRARKKLHLSYAATRVIYGAERANIPSEFLLDVGDELMEVLDSPHSELLPSIT